MTVRTLAVFALLFIPSLGCGENGAAVVETDGRPPQDAKLPVKLKAFPRAYGAGAYATGGRGGTVIQVTRLDDAHDADGKVIVFRDTLDTQLIADYRDGNGPNYTFDLKAVSPTLRIQ